MKPRTSVDKKEQALGTTTAASLEEPPRSLRRDLRPAAVQGDWIYSEVFFAAQRVCLSNSNRSSLKVLQSAQKHNNQGVAHWI
jgi:hypothetical protein